MSIQPIPPTTGPTTAGQLAARATANDNALADRVTDLESRSGTYEDMQALLDATFGEGAVTRTTSINHWPWPKLGPETQLIPNRESVEVSYGTDQGAPYVRVESTTAGPGSVISAYSARQPLPAVGTSMHVLAQYRDNVSDPAGRIRVVFYDADVNLIDTQRSPVLSASPSEWRDVTFDVTVPTDALTYQVMFAHAGDVEVGSYLEFRRLAIIEGPETAWFDGDSEGSSTTVHTWDGEPNNSTSRKVVTEAGEPLSGQSIRERFASIEAQLGGNTSHLVEMPAPAGFPGLRLIPTPTVYADTTREGAFTTSINLDALKPARTVVRYVAPRLAGLGDGDGLTPETPCELSTALNDPSVDTIIFAPGEYRRVDTTAPTPINRTVSYVAAAPGVRLTNYADPITWTQHSGHVYVGSRTAIHYVIDPRPEHSVDGLHAVYEQKDTPEDIDEPGQWATDGTDVYVWALDDTDLTAHPDTIRMAMSINTGIYHSGEDSFAYVEGIDLEGGYANAGVRAMGGATLVMVDSSVRYSFSNGIRHTGGVCILVRVDSSMNGADGITYNEHDGHLLDFVEVACTTRRNGLIRPESERVGNENGSSAHANAHGIRVGGRHENHWGPLVADVQDTQTWNIGVVTHMDFLGGHVANFHVSTTWTSAIPNQWNDSCVATGVGRAFNAGSGGVMHVRRERQSTELGGFSVNPEGTLIRY